MQGADSSVAMKLGLITRAKNRIGADPIFWGRYFKRPGDTDPTQYQPQTENAIFHATGIPVLPIARQTSRVGGTEAEGAADAGKNIKALVEAFGQAELAARATSLLVFLDVEPRNPMSAGYYTGWSRAITSATARLAPAVYVNQGDTPTWKAIKACMAANVVCAGAWVARYKTSAGCTPAPAWDATQISPNGVKVAVPLLAHQYCGDCDEIDYSVINPEFADDFQSGLIHPVKFDFDETELDLDDGSGTHQDLADLISKTLSAVADQGAARNGNNQKPYLFPNGINDIELDLTLGSGIEAKLVIKGPAGPSPADCPPDRSRE